MYAIIVTGGKQYRVQKGDVVFVEKLNAEEGSTVKFENVLAVGAPARVLRELGEHERTYYFKDRKIDPALLEGI